MSGVRDHDGERLQALLDGLREAIDRAISAGARSDDVLACLAVTFGGHVARIGGRPEVTAVLRAFTEVAMSAHGAEVARQKRDLAARGSLEP